MVASMNGLVVLYEDGEDTPECQGGKGGGSEGVTCKKRKSVSWITEDRDRKKRQGVVLWDHGSPKLHTSRKAEGGEGWQAKRPTRCNGEKQGGIKVDVRSE